VLGHPWPWGCCCLLLLCCWWYSLLEGDSKAIAGCVWPVTGKSMADANHHDVHNLLTSGQGVVVPVALKP